MTTETMTIHRGLAELKVIDSRISKLLNESVFVTHNKHSNTKIDGKPIEEIKDIIKANFDRVQSLVARKDAIKKGVDLSNAITTVDIDHKKMTVVEAIAMKNHGIGNKELLLNTLKRQYSAHKQILNKENETLNDRADNYIIALYGAKDTKTDTDKTAREKQAFIETNTIDMIDPINIEKVINDLQDEIDKFTAEIDAVLSETNATTQITIEY